MKELSIEEKAKRYDEAYKKVAVRFGSNVAEEIFPELAESEDERIRKAIKYGLDYVFTNNTTVYETTKEQCLAWLEKCMYSKDNYTDEDRKVLCDGCDKICKLKQKPADKVEPKFKVGDEIKTANEESLTITKIDEKGYWSKDLFICSFDEECIWDLAEPKPAWSEEDENRFKNLIELIEQSNEGKGTKEGFVKFINRFKSLKKPSDEQLNNILDVLSFDNCTPKRRELLESLYIDLKKLREG